MIATGNGIHLFRIEIRCTLGIAPNPNPSISMIALEC